MKELITSNDRIVTVEQLGIREAAEFMLVVLQEVYGTHNLSSSLEEVVQLITEGSIEPFFMLDGGGKVKSIAALVKNKQTVEIGRAANAPGNTGGGRLILHAVRQWESSLAEVRPLIAEIRMAAPFEGIAGGQGSQATLLGKAGMIPHAFLPSFGHPGVVGIRRQELFTFCSKEKRVGEFLRQAPQRICLPDTVEMNLPLLSKLMQINGFETEIDIGTSSNQEVLMQEAAVIPFRVLVPGDSGVVLPDIVGRGTNHNPFTLAVVSGFSPTLLETATALCKAGFVCAGISAPHQGPLELWFGKLNSCLLAPTEPMRDFPFVNSNHILQIHQQFHEQSINRL